MKFNSLKSCYGQLVHARDLIAKLQERSAVIFSLAPEGDAKEASLWLQSSIDTVLSFLRQLEHFAPWLPLSFSHKEIQWIHPILTRLDYVTSANSLKQLLEFEWQNVTVVREVEKRKLISPSIDATASTEGTLERQLLIALSNVRDFLSRSQKLRETCEKIIQATDFRPLYDERRKVLVIGFWIFHIECFDRLFCDFRTMMCITNRCKLLQSNFQ